MNKVIRKKCTQFESRLEPHAIIPAFHPLPLHFPSLPIRFLVCRRLHLAELKLVVYNWEYEIFKFFCSIKSRSLTAWLIWARLGLAHGLRPGLAHLYLWAQLLSASQTLVFKIIFAEFSSKLLLLVVLRRATWTNYTIVHGSDENLYSCCQCLWLGVKCCLIIITQAQASASPGERVSPSVSSVQPNNDKRTDGSVVAFIPLALQRKETREIRWNQERQQLKTKNGHWQASFDPKKDSDAREKATFFSFSSRLLLTLILWHRWAPPHLWCTLHWWCMMRRVTSMMCVASMSVASMMCVASKMDEFMMDCHGVPVINPL